jgi:hypothetical protein
MGFFSLLTSNDIASFMVTLAAQSIIISVVGILVIKLRSIALLDI